MKNSERTTETMQIAENYNTVKTNIEKACERAGRPAEEVTLLAVSKTKPLEMREPETLEKIKCRN